jgi:hypothetical protein
LTNLPPKFDEVEWRHPPQLRQPFPMTNFYQTFKNIFVTSGWYEYFSKFQREPDFKANAASGN